MKKSIYVAALGAAVLTNHASSAPLVGCDFSDAAVFNDPGGVYDIVNVDDLDPGDIVTVSSTWGFANGGGFTGKDDNAQSGMPQDNVTKLDGFGGSADLLGNVGDPLPTTQSAYFDVTIAAGRLVNLTSVTFNFRQATGGNANRDLAFGTDIDGLIAFREEGVGRNSDPGYVAQTVDLSAAQYQNLTDTTVRFSWFAGGGGSGDIDFDTVIVNGTVVIPDQDGDFLDDFWEDEFFGNNDGIIQPEDLTPTDGTGDFDNDNLTDKTEYDKGTHPKLKDTDVDGLDDGVETDTGNWVDSGNTGTDPLVADTDGDGLFDGVETNNGVDSYVSPTDTGTDPHETDTDFDTLTDGDEVDTGTGSSFFSDPTLEDTDGDTLTDDVEVDNGLDPNDDGTTGEDPPGSKNGPNGLTGDLDGDLVSNEDEIYGWGPTLSFFTAPDDDDSDNDGLLDGMENGTGTYVSATNTGTDPDNPDTDGDTLTDGDEVNTATGSTFFSNPLLEDTDGDTLYDDVEVNNGLDPNDDGTTGEEPPGSKNGPNGLTGDLDGDTISNEDEIFGYETINLVIFITDPDNVDTDEDGFDDNVETGGGTFTDLTNTGTDPSNPDTDRDCVLDGDENNSGNFNGATDTGTNPTVVDTDMDGFADGTEVLYGTDPTDDQDVTDINLLPDILFVGGDATEPIAGADDDVRYYMACRYGTEAITYIGAAASTAADAVGRDVVVLSSTPGSGSIRNKFPNVAAPMLNWEEAVSDNGTGEFGMSTVVLSKTGGATPTTQMDLVAHEITAGLPTTIDLYSGATQETSNTPSLFAGITSLGTAVDGAITGGTGPNGTPVAGRAMVFIAETGDAVDPLAGVDGNVAPSRRVMFPWGDNTAAFASDDFLQLFGQSLDWLMDASASITLDNPAYVAGVPNTVTADLAAAGTVDIYRSATAEPGSWGTAVATGLTAGTGVVIDPDAPALPATELYIAVPSGAPAP